MGDEIELRDELQPPAVRHGTAERQVILYLIVCCALTVVSVWAARNRMVNTGNQ
jgi:hypothetical protein